MLRTTCTKTLHADRRTALTGLLSRAPGNAKGTRPRCYTRPSSALARQTLSSGEAHDSEGDGGSRHRGEGSTTAGACGGGESRHVDVSAEEEELRDTMAKLAGRLAEIQSARERENRA